MTQPTVRLAQLVLLWLPFIVSSSSVATISPARKAETGSHSQQCSVPNAEAVKLVRELGSFPVMLFFHSVSKRVLYVEADERFVSVLLNFLVLPVGAVVKLTADCKVPQIGAVANIHHSLKDNIPDRAMENASKKVFLYPLAEGNTCCALLTNLALVVHAGYNNMMIKYPIYMSGNTRCPTFKGTRSFCNNEYVQGPSLYLITDNLEVHPSSATQTVRILKHLQVEKPSYVVQVQRYVSSVEVVQMLRASLVSDSVLNDVFKWTS